VGRTKRSCAARSASVPVEWRSPARPGGHKYFYSNENKISFNKYILHRILYLKNYYRSSEEKNLEKVDLSESSESKLGLKSSLRPTEFIMMEREEDVNVHRENMGGENEEPVRNCIFVSFKVEFLG